MSRHSVRAPEKIKPGSGGTKDSVGQNPERRGQQGEGARAAVAVSVTDSSCCLTLQQERWGYWKVVQMFGETPDTARETRAPLCRINPVVAERVPNHSARLRERSGHSCRRLTHQETLPARNSRPS